MKLVELYRKVRYAVQIEGISRREAARRFLPPVVGAAPNSPPASTFVSPDAK